MAIAALNGAGWPQNSAFQVRELELGEPVRVRIIHLDNGKLEVSMTPNPRQKAAAEWTAKALWNAFEIHVAILETTTFLPGLSQFCQMLAGSGTGDSTTEVSCACLGRHAAPLSSNVEATVKADTRSNYGSKSTVSKKQSFKKSYSISSILSLCCHFVSIFIALGFFHFYHVSSARQSNIPLTPTESLWSSLPLQVARAYYHRFCNVRNLSALD